MVLHINMIVSGSPASKGRHKGMGEGDITDMFEEHGGAWKMFELALWDGIRMGQFFVYEEIEGKYGIGIYRRKGQVFRISASGDQYAMANLVRMLKGLYLTDGCDVRVKYSFSGEGMLDPDVENVLKTKNPEYLWLKKPSAS